jgi:hypothetical protein
MDEVLPGEELVREGLEDLRRGLRTVPAWLVSIGAPRLRLAGLSVPEALPEPEHGLYEALSRDDPDAAHGRYDALVRRLVSYEHALESAGRPDG